MNAPEASRSESNSSDPDSDARTAQWGRLLTLYRRFPSNPWSPEQQKQLGRLFHQLQSFEFSDLLQQAFSASELEHFREIAEQHLHAYQNINRERVRSLWTLATPELQEVVREALTLFHYNPSEVPPQIVERTIGYDEDGQPIMDSSEFEIFPEGAPYGLEAREAFLGACLDDEETSLQKFFTTSYPELSSSAEEPTELRIRAMTTIGSLGGIGHKPDSDIDAQVIVDTDPVFPEAWNDLDFLLTLLDSVFAGVHKRIFEESLDDERREKMHSAAMQELLRRCGEGMSEEEKLVLDKVLPSTFQQIQEALLWKLLPSLKRERLHQIVLEELKVHLQRYPDFSKMLEPLRTVFPPLAEKLSAEWLARSLPVSAVVRRGSSLRVLLLRFYQTAILGQTTVKSVLKDWQSSREEADPPTSAEQAEFLWKRLVHSAILPRICKEFREYLLTHLGLRDRDKLSEALEQLHTLLPQETGDASDEGPTPEERLVKHVRAEWADLIEFRRRSLAQALEAQWEYPLHLKTNQVEAYLTKKYPEVETHFFRNILRRMRAGEHTPFLVSPEGSLAYSSLLNDFLLNPGTLLSGMPPMPFELPREFRNLLVAGVFSASDWEVSHPFRAGDQLPLKCLPDWGDVLLSREMFLEHVVPIFLRESEKVSHRNLPKALLNCWWIEMLCLEHRPRLTSLTRLLLHPKLRHGISEENEHPDAQRLREIEADFPQLLQDPWWIKFSEMLLRFAESDFRDELVFCFAGHMRLSDVVDEEGRPLFMAPEQPWRMHAMLKFYQLFFSEEARLELVHFSQGRDETANRIESRLKQLFLESMRRVEGYLCLISQQQALSEVRDYLQLCSPETLDTQELEAFLEPLMVQVHHRVSLEEQGILRKLKLQENLTPLERLQAQNLLDDHERLSQAIRHIQDRFGESLLSSRQLQQVILRSRVPIGGDQMENFIFKHHFERNFRRKPYQIALPIAKSLSLPRRGILLRYDPESQRWHFFSRLPRREAGNEHLSMMFTENLAQGVARCVLSGYVGFGKRNHTAFQKDLTSATDPVAQNPFAADDLEELARELNECFGPMRLLPRELLSGQHYVRDLFVACNVNRYGVLTLVVRDNLEESFAIDYPLPDLKQLRPEMPEFFAALNTKKAREGFRKALRSLQIKLDEEQLKTFRIWVNPRSFMLSINPRYRSVYLSGIASRLWTRSGPLAPWAESPKVLRMDGLESWGRESIDAYQQERAELRRKQMERLAQVRKASQDYLLKVERELKERERQLMA